MLRELADQIDNLSEVLLQHFERLTPEEIRLLGERLKALSEKVANASIPSQTPLKLAASARLAEAKGFVHPFQQMLLERGQSLSDAARELDLKLPQIKSWVRGAAPNRIKRRTADLIAKVYGFEATADHWPNGILEDSYGPRGIR